MSELKVDCPYYAQCLNKALLDMFARVGDRKLMLPRCEYCNVKMEVADNDTT